MQIAKCKLQIDQCAGVMRRQQCQPQVFHFAICILQFAICKVPGLLLRIAGRFSRQIALGILLLTVAAIGCRQDMADQPKYLPLEQSDLFADKQASRPLEPGTVARGYLQEDSAFFTGAKETDIQPAWVSALIGAGTVWNVVALSVPMQEPVAEFPFPITEAVMKHGQERFNIYCAVCHDRVGTGHGRIVQRGYIHPPSFHTDRLRKAPVGHFFQVITRGFGAMPDYAQQISPSDRWAIVAYVRALQESQNTPLKDIPEEVQRRLDAEVKQ
jgi:mono/diheme cytochrome c family protein